MFRNKIYIILSTILLIASIFGTVYLVKQNQDSRTKAASCTIKYENATCFSVTNCAGQTILSFSKPYSGTSDSEDQNVCKTTDNRETDRYVPDNGYHQYCATPSPGTCRQVDHHFGGVNFYDGTHLDPGGVCACKASTGGAPACDSSKLNMVVSPSSVLTGQSITLSLSGSQGSTNIGDTFPSGINCPGFTVTWPMSQTCTAATPGTYTWTHTWKNCSLNCEQVSSTCSKSVTFTIVTPTNTPTPTPTPKATNTPTPTPEPEPEVCVWCGDCMIVPTPLPGTDTLCVVEPHPNEECQTITDNSGRVTCLVVTNTPTPTPKATNTPTPTPTATPTSTPTPTPTSTPTSTPTPSPSPKATPTIKCDNNIASYAVPDPVRPHSTISFVFTSNQHLTDVTFDPKDGAYQCKFDVTSDRCIENPMHDSRDCWWKWSCTSQDDTGTFTSSFSNKENCPKDITYRISTSLNEPTNTPTPKPTAAPSIKPSPTTIKTPNSTATPTPKSPTPTKVYIAQGSTATPVILPESGIDFPVQMLTIIGAIVTLVGFLILL